MDEEKFVKLLKEHFPTKKEFLDFKIEIYEFRKETKETLKNIDQTSEVVNGKLDELKDSSNTLDEILEGHPMERIKRLEDHNHLPIFIPVSQED